MNPVMLGMFIGHLILVVWAFPWYDKRGHVGLLVLIALFGPVVSWPWLIVQGQVQRARSAQLEAQRARAASVAFLRSQLADGTPVEQENARQLLAMWDVPEQEPPPLPPVDDGLVHVVGGLPRAHFDPPSLEYIWRGCDCPACLDFAGAITGARSQTGWAQALDQVTRQITSGLAVPPAQLGPETCRACEREEFEQRNALGQVVIRTTRPTRLCARHQYLFDTPR